MNIIWYHNISWKNQKVQETEKCFELKKYFRDYTSWL